VKAFVAGPYNCKESMHIAANSGATPRSLYFGDNRGDLYAVNAQTGSLRWCVHLNIPVQQITSPCGIPHCPSIPVFLFVGTPAIVDGVVYVCVSSFDKPGSTYAFNASDGSLRWHTESNCGMNSMAFYDTAVPLVDNGIVYSGIAALRAQDGQVLWKESRASIVQEGAFMPLGVADGVLYANTQAAAYAFNAADGSMRWRYPSHASITVSGPLAVSFSNQTLIIGTTSSVDQPETSAAYAVNIGNGSLRWYHLMGDYKGATFVNNVAYVSSGDGYLYAFNAIDGHELWRTKLDYSSYPPTAAHGIVYTNSDGAYAVDSANGKILWHRSLGYDPSFSFGPPVVVDGTDFFSSMGGRQGISTIYALNASTGAEYWHSSGSYQISPPAVG
jgi:outer membrane protein assembly factor BamB